MADIKKNLRCRMCKKGDMPVFFDLGKQPLANSFLSKAQLSQPEPFYPLRVAWCKNCYLAQLADVVRPQVLFRNYVYFSRAMPALPTHFQNYACEVKEQFISSKDDLVVELGSNDGLLLGAIQEMGVKVLGVDPAINIAKVANDRGIKTFPEFFSAKLAKQIVKEISHAKVIIGNNVVAHIDNHHDLIRGVKFLLEKKGVFVFEAPYLIDMFENYTFDTIYHEHLSYLAVKPLKKLMGKFGLEIFDVKIFPVQGNSLRVYVGHPGKHKVTPTVEQLISKEEKLKLDRLESYHTLVKSIEAMKDKVNTLLKKLKKQGKKIYGYGAPAKGNTLLNYFGIGNDILDLATEELDSKIGFYTPGTHIKVVHIEEARVNPPDYYLLLAWNYKDSAIQKEEKYLRKGGKFIMPVGKVGII